MNTADTSLWRRLWYTRLADLVRGRWNASLDWHAVIATADLPPELAELVTCVARRTRLWHREKVDVARELVAHFQDGLEAGRTPGQLVESFGDPRQAARLIRRAKRRGRPLVWHLWHYGLWTLLLLAILYVLSAVCLLILRPAPSTDYLAELNAGVKDLAPEDRAWPVYRSGLLELGFHYPNWERTEQSGLDTDARPGDEHWPQLKDFLEVHAEALAKLRTAAARPYLGYEVGFEIAPQDRPLWGTVVASPPEGGSDAAQAAEDASIQPLFEVLLTDVDALRTVARFLMADTYRAVEDGDAQTVYDDIVALLGISRQIGQSPFLISGMVSLQVEGFACESVEHVMTVHPGLWSDRQIVQLAHLLGASRYRVADWLRTERLFTLDVLQHLYTDDGHGDGTITFSGIKLADQWGRPSEGRRPSSDEFGLAIGMPLMVGWIASRAEQREELERLFDMAEVDLQTPLWKKHETMDEAAERFSRSPWLRVKYAPVMYTLPAVGSFRRNLERARGQAEGVMVGLTLELYRRENGRWPAALDELTPRWLPAVPVDRINGGPLGYRVVDDRPIVYSLGNDGDDDGGQRPKSQLRRDGSGGINPYEISVPDPYRESGDWVIWSTVPQPAGTGGGDAPAR